MEDLDLDLGNYDLDDIMNLFHLDYNFGKAELKQAHRIALKTHPDKSGLPDKFFIFFMSAYKVISKIYYFRSKRNRDLGEYQAETDPCQIELLRKLDGKSVREFNTWFNKMFEKIKIKDLDADSGYGKWYKEEELSENEKVPLSDFGRVFEKKKEKCRALTVQGSIEMLGDDGGYSLSRAKPQEYSSRIFSKLRYDDLRKAHTESVVPVTRRDFDNKQKFNNLDSLKRHRMEQIAEPQSLRQAREYLDQQHQEKEELSARRMYSMLKHDEEVEKMNKVWWAHLKQLTGE